MTDPNVLLEVKNLKKHFPITGGVFSRVVGHVRAVDGVDFALNRGKTLALVGESGCGKSTVGRVITRLYHPTDGQIIFHGENEAPVDLAQLENRELRPYRRYMQMIFQDPRTSLNARKTIFQIVSEPLRLNHVASGQALEERVVELLRLVGLRPEYMSRYPNAFSGGQRQRIGIARALALNPRILVADEPVSALDVSVKAQILNLMKYLQQELDLTYLFISHDLSVVKHISDRVAVMYVGKIVEQSTSSRVYASPKHPYTEALLSAMHIPDPASKHSENRVILKGEVADPSNPPSGCYFHPRCRFAEEICHKEEPPLIEVEPGHLSACHFANDLNLIGIDIIKTVDQPNTT